jgi:hypothetical protein
MTPARLIEPRELLRGVIGPQCSALAALTGRPQMADPRAVFLLCCIAITESDLRYTRQTPQGPARSLWQIEPLTGGLAMRRAAINAGWQDVLDLYDLGGPLGEVLTDNQQSAAAAARLLLWFDPQPLPPMENPWAALRCYLAVWRPGKPHPDRFMRAHAETVAAAVGVL